MSKIPMLEKFAAQSLVESDGELIFSKEKFAELIVKMCADAADMYEGKSDCVGDCVAEYMGYGQEEGVTEWRAK